MSAKAMNLGVITAAIDHHDEVCTRDLTAIHMCWYEVERLGWDEIKGIPVVADLTVPAGRFRLIWSGDHELPEPAAEREAVPA